jgi:hypothetical protein
MSVLCYTVLKENQTKYLADTFTPGIVVEMIPVKMLDGRDFFCPLH